jgi:hypothetical protein
MQGKKEEARSRASNVRKTPALVSAISTDGLVTVLYPNNFVLMHGFKGEPLKRVPDVPPERLRPFASTDFSLQLLEKAMQKAIKAEANTRSPAKRETSRSRSPKSRSRSPKPSEVGSRAFQTPEGERRRLTRKQSEEKVESSLAAKAAPADDKWRSKAKSLDATPDARRFTASVGRLLRASECARLPRNQLETSLMDSGFDKCDIAVGLERLDSLSKILLMDGLVFLL